MKISRDLSDEAILREVGGRLAAARLARNLTQAALADAAGVSKRTVEYHISNLYAKTGVTNRVALAALLR